MSGKTRLAPRSSRDVAKAVSWDRVIRIGEVAAAAGGIITLLLIARPFIISDNPPWANVARVKESQTAVEGTVQDTGNRLETLIIRGNIRGAWRDYCNAMRAGNMGLADTYNTAIGDLQAEYQMLTGGTQYPLRPC